MGWAFLHRDYLGSILAITDASGAILEERQFGAWGTVDRFRASDGSTTFGHSSLLGRGYTGHEHFFEVGLIHMNGRMYDPVMGRFLSPDNYVQDPYNTQNFNRYGYVLNNPLVHNDPSGEFAWFIPVLIGAAIGAASAALQEGANFGSILTGGLIGGAAGLVGFGLGNLASGGSFFVGQAVSGFAQGFGVGLAAGASGGFVSAAGSIWANGGSFADGFGAGIKGAFFGGLAGGLINGVTSGISAVKNGKNFWSGIERSTSINSKAIIAAELRSLGKLSPRVEVEGDFYSWTDTVEGPNGNTIFRTGKASGNYTYKITNRVFDLETTLRMNAIQYGQDLQLLGDGMQLAGYGLTLTGVGAKIGVPLAGFGGSTSFAGSLLEAAGSANWAQGGTAFGGFAADAGAKALINRIPGSVLTRQIINQNVSLKINLVEKLINQ